MLTESTCSFCKGSGEAEKWDVAVLDPPVSLPDGDLLTRVMAGDCMEDVLGAISAGRYPGVIPQWYPVECPVCNGRGRYEVEHVAAKIF